MQKMLIPSELMDLLTSTRRYLFCPCRRVQKKAAAASVVIFVTVALYSEFDISLD